MEGKINVAEKLKDCPKGTELYSPIFGTVYFEGIRDTGRAILIDVTTSCNTEVQFYSDGKYNTYYSGSEPTLFPSKGQRDWSKFQRSFKDGDILYVKAAFDWICIYKESEDTENVYGYVAVRRLPNATNIYKYECCLCCRENISEIRLATEEEKEKLFKAIKDNGYKWNAETKTLERLGLPKSYTECCEVLELGKKTTFVVAVKEKEAVSNYIKLRRCRNAYWKLANDWKPDWIAKMDKYTITTWKGRISLDTGTHHNQFLVFPTKKMRDEFYSNFKSLIEECKEFL